MDSFSYLVNLVDKSLLEIIKFLKRDFFEISYLNDFDKIESFFNMTINKNFERLINSLLKYNVNYGVIHNNKKVVESSIGAYWVIKIIDNFENYVNNIEFWGIYISLFFENEEKLVFSMYNMPMLNNVFFVSEDYGCFFNNKKLDLLRFSKNYIGFNDRKFGSDELSIFFVSCQKLNSAVIKKTNENLMLVEFVMKECKGKFIKDLNNIYIGSDFSVKNFKAADGRGFEPPER